MSFGGSGIREWLIQRVTAVYLVFYLGGLLIMCVRAPVLDHQHWRALFAEPLLQLATFLAFASLALHSWVGIWTVATDYIKAPTLRLILLGTVVLVLAGELIWGIDLLRGIR